MFFFASPEAGAAWSARRPGTFLLSLAQAFELARRKNGVQFPEVRDIGSVHGRGEALVLRGLKIAE